MKNLYYILALFIMSPAFVVAASDISLKDQIEGLKTTIADLQKQIEIRELDSAYLWRDRGDQKVVFSKRLVRGMGGDDVYALQKALALDTQVYPEALITGYYGFLTEEAVKRFQKKRGLEQVGVVGPKTRAQLNGLKEDVESVEFGEVIDKSVEWFVNAQEENGHFKYEYHPFTDIYSDDDHIVRQAGALYALGEVLRRDMYDVSIMKPMVEKEINFMLENTVEGSYNGYDFHCLLMSQEKCTMGGTTLALVGVISYVQAVPAEEDKYSDLIEGYTNYILASKKESAGFRNYYYRWIGQTETESWFSNGEALLGLVRSNQYQPRDDVSKVIDNTFDYLASQEEWDHNLYLWAMAAIKDMHTDKPLQKYVDYVEPYTYWRMDSQKSRRSSPRNRCAYLEGVVSAHSVLKDTVSVAGLEKIEEEINFWAKKSSHLQVLEDDSAYIKSKDKYSDIMNEDLAVGGFVTAENELVQRIDFTQHCLNSFVQIEKDIK